MQLTIEGLMHRRQGTATAACVKISLAGRPGRERGGEAAEPGGMRFEVATERVLDQPRDGSAHRVAADHVEGHGELSGGGPPDGRAGGNAVHAFAVGVGIERRARADAGATVRVVLVTARGGAGWR
jgi:hypothetical protein